MKRLAIALSILFLLGIGAAARGDDRVIQFIIDPFSPDQAWMLTEQNLQFNSNLKAQGRWEVRFDRATFSAVTGIDPGSGYRNKKMQASKSRVGHLYLLVENTDPFGANRVLYIFSTNDYGATWKYVLMGARKPPPPAPPVGKKDMAESTKKEDDSGGAVDLNSLGGDSGDTAKAAGTEEHHGGGPPPSSGPVFKILFDLLLTLRPGMDALTFDNYHAFLLADVIPRPDLHFMFDVEPNPYFYELDYQPTPRLTVRAGKILISFDQMDPHNTFGGWFNTSKLFQPPNGQGYTPFLPDIWADLGVGVRYQLADEKDFSLLGDFSVTNGFGTGGTDPVTPNNPIYPQFTATETQDDHTDKAFTARLHAELWRTWGIGVSAYTQRYSADSQSAERMNMLGFDTELRLTSGTDFHFGYIYMEIDLPSPELGFLRGGLYADVGQKLGERWKLQLRGGTSQNDSRAVSPSDKTLLGARLIYDMGLFKFSYEAYHDFNDTPGKVTRDFMALRGVVLF